MRARGAAALAIRRMSEADLVLALEWAAAVGWNPGLHDARSFYAADPDGFLLGELDGRPVGSVSAVRYGPAFGFLGLYIVKAEHRGRGFGLELWRAALDHLGDRVVGLDGVAAQQDNYRKSGFKLAFRNIRQRCEGGGGAPPGLIDLATVPIEEIVRYDGTAFPAPRRAFLASWIGQPQAFALGATDGDALRGYGVLRACREGFKIGPLFADNREAAERILAGLIARAPGAPVFLDTPEANPAALALARRFRMTPRFETARMYKNGSPEMRLDRCFGVTSFELG
jgi:Acetyltransferase (GNAT) domain/Acetyltransferase (GNAT) family